MANFRSIHLYRLPATHMIMYIAQSTTNFNLYFGDAIRYIHPMYFFRIDAVQACRVHVGIVVSTHIDRFI